MVCAAIKFVILKIWWSVWCLRTCHMLLTIVYKNRQFVPIYSKVIPQ